MPVVQADFDISNIALWEMFRILLAFWRDIGVWFINLPENKLPTTEFGHLGFWLVIVQDSL